MYTSSICYIHYGQRFKLCGLKFEQSKPSRIQNVTEQIVRTVLLG